MKIISGQKGNLLAIAVILIVGISVFGITVLKLLTSASNTTNQFLFSQQSKYLAESGIQYGTRQIKNNIDVTNQSAYCDGNWKTTQTLGSGEFRFKCSSGFITTGVTLASALTSSLAETVIHVTSLTKLPSSGTVEINSENISYSSTSTDAATCGTGKTPCLIIQSRNVNWTSIASHSSGDVIKPGLLILTSEGAVPSVTSPNAKTELQQGMEVYIPAGGYSNGWLVGELGHIFRRSPSGSQWEFFTQTNASDVLKAVACSNASFCLTVGNGGITYAWNGSNWSAKTSATTGSPDFKSIACTTSNGCFAVASNNYIYRWTTSSGWSTYSFSNPINDISCASNSFCMAVGDAGLVYQWNGSSWASSAPIDTDGLNAVSCPTTSVCYAVGIDGKIIKYSSGTWAAETKPNSINFDIQTISCGDTNNCWSFGNTRSRNAWLNAGTWEKATGTTFSGMANTTVNDVACINASFCWTAQDPLTNWKAGRWNGTNWIDSPFATVLNPSKLYGVGSDGSGGSNPNILKIYVWKEVFN